MNNKIMLYEIIDLVTGEQVISGTNAEICRHLRLKRTLSLSNYAKKKAILYKRYKVKLIGQESSETLEQKSDENEVLNSQIANLKRFGNTVAMKDLSKNIRMLNERKVKVKARKVMDYDEEEEEHYYILERIND